MLPIRFPWRTEVPQSIPLDRPDWRSGLWSLVVLMGCGSRIHGGFTAPLSDPSVAPAVQGGLHASTLFLAGASLRGFASADMVTMATGLEVGFPAGFEVLNNPYASKGRGRKRGGRRFFTPHAVAGFHALQLEFADDASFAAGSPYLQLGGSVCRSPSAPRCIGLTLDGTYMVRFHDDNQSWLGVSVIFSRFWDDVGG